MQESMREKHDMNAAGVSRVWEDEMGRIGHAKVNTGGDYL
jgi:hypothetical protein